MAADEKSLSLSLKRKINQDSSGFSQKYRRVSDRSQCVDMAAASSFLSEEQFLCSICLDVFTDPVTIPCGHNFCKTCITQQWDISGQCQCPMCKELFNTRPMLRINTFISEMAAQFIKSAQIKSSSCPDQRCAKRVVPCDVCTGTKLKALKSCLVCLVSYCETHLEPHQRITGLKAHKLIDPVENLEGRMCKKHDGLLQLFCKTDQMCVCLHCTVLDHKLHDIVPLEEEYEGKKAELGKTEAEIQQMIQERNLKIQEIKHSVELSKEDADREIADSVQVFTALMQSVERGQAELIETIEEKQKTTEKQAEGFIKELEEEISELMKRTTEMKQLSRTEDHLHLLQSFPSLNTPPHTKDWTEVSVHRSSYEGTVRRAVAQLEETLRKEMEKLLEAELKGVQQYAVDVTLDPHTAHPYLILSDDGKQVNCGDVEKNLPENPERFSPRTSVLGKQSFSSGRFYYEVQVKGKTDWDLGVASGSINRKGQITLNPKNGYWTIWLRNGNEYEASAGPDVPLSLKTKPQRVGVFVDYEEGLVSFYDVGAAALIYSYTGCTFTEKLFPYFCPCINGGGKNSTPLIISPVSHTNY
ncbi:E3 ubiquitin-protein ligase TRIM21-like [Centroberyx affinis]|uniref:E3 ubiquitin-protein ligase TRIM21-like n=1 Tax=Centroberyx affinis TaxID=166261 RepID=UPI003A5BDB8C